MTHGSDAWPVLVAPGELRVDETTTMRPWIPEDASALASAWADPALIRWLDPPPASVERAARWIEGSQDRLRSGTALDLVIDRGGFVAGEVGLTSFDAPRRACLVGYWVDSEHRGRGLAAAAVRCTCAYARDELGVRTFVAECHPDNTASHRTAEHAGFTLLAPDHKGSRVYVLV